MGDQGKEFEDALKDKKIPILVLDQKWHRLFAIHGKTEEIAEEEAKLNALLAKQGKLNNSLKELKKTKNKLMDEVVKTMDSDGEENRENIKNKIDQTTASMEEIEDQLLEIPSLIKASNEKLMLLSMDYFYDKLKVNKEEASEIEKWINQVRIDLKKNIIRKQNREINNREIYSYLHDIFGLEILNLFDLEYDYSEDSKANNNEG